MQHYFLNEPLAVGQKVQLSSDISKHWLKVMRATICDEAEFVASDHQLFIGRLVDESNGTIEITKALPKNVELPINVTIACGLPKSGKPELIVQKATEMGVAQIIFLPTAWSIAKWDQKAAKKITRLQSVAKSAAEQSHRNVIPTVKYVNSVNDLLKLSFDQKVVAYEEAAKQGESSNLVKVVNKMQPGQSLLGVFGPEGGIAPAEIETFIEHGCTLVGLGPRILRTESAPLYFLSAVSTLCELK